MQITTCLWEKSQSVGIVIYPPFFTENIFSGLGWILLFFADFRLKIILWYSENLEYDISVLLTLPELK